MFIFGTRPEAIKMAPLIKEFQKYPEEFQTIITVTAQHREMLDQVLEFFQITPDHDLDLMRSGQTLTELTVRSMTALQPLLTDQNPDLVFVQGDTTTVFTAALCCYYLQIPLAHLEAGLRSYDLCSPFPEEANRRLTSHLASYHFAPASAAVENLQKENIEDNVWQVGNSVIDALNLGLEIISGQGEEKYLDRFSQIDFEKKIILMTGHRRESFGQPFADICQAVKQLAVENTDIELVYPVHLNPNVQIPVNEILADIPRVHLIEPLSYPEFIWLLRQSYLVLTDSGGVQEEAPSLGKPVLVTRDVTERMEGVRAGTALIVGTQRENIVAEVRRLLTEEQHYQQMSEAHNPYGDGKTSARILQIIRQHFS